MNPVTRTWIVLGNSCFRFKLLKTASGHTTSMQYDDVFFWPKMSAMWIFVIWNLEICQIAESANRYHIMKEISDKINLIRGYLRNKILTRCQKCVLMKLHRMFYFANLICWVIEQLPCHKTNVEAFEASWNIYFSVFSTKHPFIGYL